MLLVCLSVPGRMYADTHPVFAVVNGEALTTSDLDAAMMEMHRGSDMAGQENFDFTRIVDKVINDRLILQEAALMGLPDEPSVVGPVYERQAQEAIRRYIRDRFSFDETVSDADVRAYVDAYYWKIQLSQLSARTEEEALAILAALDAGAAWDSVARTSSVDSHRYRGGRHNLKYWADVETPIRDAIQGVPDGGRSPLFAYNGLVSVVRVDERQPVEPGAYERFEKAIRAELAAMRQQEAWERFVAEHAARIPVLRNEEVLDVIRADSTLVLKGEFRSGTRTPVLGVDDRHTIDEASLRLAVSRSAMENGGQPFAAHLDRAVEQKSRQLILAAAAEAAGYFEDPAVVSDHDQALRTALIEAYLNETVVPQIAFRHDEFQAYYAEHADTFREPERVQLATLVVEEEAVARDIANRLKAGADFNFVKAQVQGTGSEVQEQALKWSVVTLFSDAIREQIASLAIGETSEAIDIGHNWLVFKLNGRKPGGVRPLEDVEPEIRRVMFDRKLREALDTHLSLLRERSDITVHQDVLDAYVSGES